MVSISQTSRKRKNNRHLNNNNNQLKFLFRAVVRQLKNSSMRSRKKEMHGTIQLIDSQKKLIIGWANLEMVFLLVPQGLSDQGRITSRYCCAHFIPSCGKVTNGVSLVWTNWLNQTRLRNSTERLWWCAILIRLLEKVSQIKFTFQIDVLLRSTMLSMTIKMNQA